MGATPCVEKVPCFSCCDEGTRNGQRRMPQSMKTLRHPGFDVELAVSPLAGLKGAAGYHTSVLVAAEEYFFSPLGIVHSPVITSHKCNPEMQLMHIGLSKYGGVDLMEFLDQYFPPGHYDLLRKNCNSFSDCALYFLCEQRLDLKFRSLERLGKMADDHAGMIQKMSGGEYLPNPRAVDFDVEEVIEDIKAEHEAREANLEADMECTMDMEPTDHAGNIFAQDDFLPKWDAYGGPSGAQSDETPRCWQADSSPQKGDVSEVRDKPRVLNVEQDAGHDLEQHNPFKTRLPRWQAEGADQGLIGGA